MDWGLLWLTQASASMCLQDTTRALLPPTPPLRPEEDYTTGGLIYTHRLSPPFFFSIALCVFGLFMCGRLFQQHRFFLSLSLFFVLVSLLSIFSCPFSLICQYYPVSVSLFCQYFTVLVSLVSIFSCPCLFLSILLCPCLSFVYTFLSVCLFLLILSCPCLSFVNIFRSLC